MLQEAVALLATARARWERCGELVPAATAATAATAAHAIHSAAHAQVDRDLRGHRGKSKLWAQERECRAQTATAAAHRRGFVRIL